MDTDRGDAPDPSPSTYPSDTSLRTMLAEFEARGFASDFDVDEERGDCRCGTCGTTASPADIEVVDSRRLEGASDPAEMSSVLALRCPACGAAGTVAVRYGPEASAGEAELLRSARGANRS